MNKRELGMLVLSVTPLFLSSYGHLTFEGAVLVYLALIMHGLWEVKKEL